MLVADDHTGIVKAVCRLLSLDCDVVGSVADGSAVLEAAQRLQPDVMVLDINLPNVHGLEACRQITQGNPQMKVIVFTAMNDPGNQGDDPSRTEHLTLCRNSRWSTTCYRPSES